MLGDDGSVFEEWVSLVRGFFLAGRTVPGAFVDENVDKVEGEGEGEADKMGADIAGEGIGTGSRTADVPRDANGEGATPLARGVGTAVS